ncbi:MAG: right-handed parallel beta-helix repeat-containing protein, partial [Actinomycetia bacterium]|nr:right-handed parallel beta-helix repeat-containing protein [Actinomycetes bacterium]
ASVSPASGVPQDFTTGPRTYTVTAPDGTTQAYTVAVGYDTSDLTIAAAGVGSLDVTPGATAGLSVTVANHGTTDATGVVVSVPVPTGVDPASVTVVSGPGTYDPASGTWSLPGLGAATATPTTATLELRFTVPASAHTGDRYRFTARLTTVNGLPVTATASAPVDFIVALPGQAWLRPSVAAPQIAVAGVTGYTYTVTLGAVGSAALTNVQATHQIPAGFANVTAVASTGTYDPAGGVWTIPSLPAGTSPTLTVTGDIPAGTAPGSWPLTLTVNTLGGTAPGYDLSASYALAVHSAPTVGIGIGPDNLMVAAGDTVTVNASFYSNYTYYPVSGTVHVTLPDHATLTDADAGGGTFDAATGTWTTAVIDNSNTSLKLTFTIDPAARPGDQVTTGVLLTGTSVGVVPPGQYQQNSRLTVGSVPAQSALTFDPLGTNVHTVVLHWDAVADDSAGGTGQAASYQVMTCVVATNACAYADMTIAPKPAGTHETLYVNNLDPGVTYSFQQRTQGTNGLWSPWSNAVRVTTGPQPGVVPAVTVHTLDDLQAEINSAPPQGKIITLAAGVYQEKNTLSLYGKNNVTIQGATNNPADTVIQGYGMNDATVNHNLYVNGSSYVTVRNLTLKDSYTHGIQIANGSQYFHAENLVTWDNGESGFKISGGGFDGVVGEEQYSDYGTIDNCRIGFSTYGARDVIEGIDGVAARGWQVKSNTVENVRYAPGAGGPAYAMYFKGNSIDDDFLDNTVINSDIGLSYGDGSTGYMYFRYHDTSFETRGGLMANNVVKSTSSDTGIVLRGATGFKVYNNTIWNTGPNSPVSIALRISDVVPPAGYPTPQPTQDGQIVNNILRLMIEPNWGSGNDQLPATIQIANNLAPTDTSSATDPAIFVDAAGGDFHLAPTATPAIGQGRNLYADVPYDADGVARPLVGAFDLGAYQLEGVAVEPPRIVTTSLPSGTVGAPYGQTLAAVGGEPIVWSLDGGGLPDGLTLAGNGAITGTPLVAGTSTFIVRATNPAGYDTAQLSIAVAATAAQPQTLTFDA